MKPVGARAPIHAGPRSRSKRRTVRAPGTGPRRPRSSRPPRVCRRGQRPETVEAGGPTSTRSSPISIAEPNRAGREAVGRNPRKLVQPSPPYRNTAPRPLSARAAATIALVPCSASTSPNRSSGMEPSGASIRRPRSSRRSGRRGRHGAATAVRPVAPTSARSPSIATAEPRLSPGPAPGTASRAICRQSSPSFSNTYAAPDLLPERRSHEDSVLESREGTPNRSPRAAFSAVSRPTSVQPSSRLP